MNETIEADVDARSTVCDCCGDELEAKGPRSRLCSDCTTEGCDPSTGLCLKELGDA